MAKLRTLVTLVLIASTLTLSVGSCGVLGIFPQTFSLDVRSGADEFGTPLEHDAAEGTNDASTYPMPDGTMGALVGKIGSGGEVFEIGADALISATATGELYVVVNDNMMDNNEGILDVEVMGTGLLAR